MNDFKTTQNLFFFVTRIFLQYKVPKLKTLRIKYIAYELVTIIFTVGNFFSSCILIS